MNLPRFLTIALLMFLQVSCREAPDGRAAVRQQIEQLKTQTVPPDAENVSGANLSLDAFSTKASWEFDTALGEMEYRNWLAAKLRDSLGFETQNEPRFVAKKHFRGDPEMVTVEVISRAPRLHVRVILEIVPS